MRLSKMDGMLAATFLTTVFYSATYPYIHKEVMIAASDSLIAISQIINCLSVMVFGCIWNRWSGRLFKYYPALCIAETVLGVGEDFGVIDFFNNPCPLGLNCRCEVLKYNPDFDYHKERDWTTALISDFKGTVQFVVEHEEGVYEEDSDYWKAGDKWEDYSLHVVGHGINKKTGESINFRSTQTGL